MPLTLEQLQMITEIDNKVNQVLLENGDDTKVLLAFFGNIANTIEFSLKITNFVSRKELGLYCFHYPGFFYFLRIIDKILGRFARGEISVHKIKEMIEKQKKLLT